MSLLFGVCLFNVSTFQIRCKNTAFYSYMQEPAHFFCSLPALFFTQGTFTTHLRLFQHSFTTLSAHPNCAFFVFFLLISKKSSTFAPDLAHTANDR